MITRNFFFRRCFLLAEVSDSLSFASLIDVDVPVMCSMPLLFVVTVGSRLGRPGEASLTDSSAVSLSYRISILVSTKHGQLNGLHLMLSRYKCLVSGDTNKDQERAPMTPTFHRRDGVRRYSSHSGCIPHYQKY